jgi:glycosyltransferase involved in cell wall biosynthesis
MPSVTTRHKISKRIEATSSGADRHADLPNARRTVVVLSTDYWLDSLHGSSIVGLFRALSKVGYRVSILVPSIRRRNERAGFFSVVGLHVRRYIPLITLISLYRQALRHVLKERNSVIVFDPSMFSLFLLAWAFKKSEGIMFILSRPLVEKGFRSQLLLLNFRLLLMLGKSFVKRITGITPFEVAEFSRMGKIPSRMMAVLPSPLGREFEESSFPKDKNELRLGLGLETLVNKSVLLYQGVLDKRRGILDFLELFVKSFKGNNEIALLIIGDGPARDSVENFVAHNQAANIVFLGPLPYSKMPEAIEACDIGLVLLPDRPLWRYQCPTKLVEFLALGKPVIASDLPGIRWVADNSRLVLLIKQLTTSNLNEAIKKLLMREEDTATDYARIHQKIVDRFSSLSLAKTLDCLISSDCT